MTYDCRFKPRNSLKSIAVVCSLILSGLLPSSGHSQQASNGTPPAESKIQTEQIRDTACKIVYLGIVGGTEPSNNRHSGVVQIRDVLRGPAYPDVCAKTFSPYFWRSGFHWTLAHFPTHPGHLTKDELEGAPKVILVGHSLGGWGVLSVARNLNRKGIPVDLCVQIDSVGITDHTVPRNVRTAAIFHANDAMFLLTTKTIKLEDASQTKLVENILVKNAGHWSITRDQRIKDLVLCAVKAFSSVPEQISNCSVQSGPTRAVSPSYPPSAGQ